MNERIRELARQAGATVDKGTHPLTGVVDGLFMGPNEVEKFAELIVRECAKFLDENSGYDYSMSAWHPEPEEMLQHFGIEK